MNFALVVELVDTADLKSAQCRFESCPAHHVPVAQLDRARNFYFRCRGFESLRGRHYAT